MSKNIRRKSSLNKPRTTPKGYSEQSSSRKSLRSDPVQSYDVSIDLELGDESVSQGFDSIVDAKEHIQKVIKFFKTAANSPDICIDSLDGRRKLSRFLNNSSSVGKNITDLSIDLSDESSSESELDFSSADSTDSNLYPESYVSEDYITDINPSQGSDHRLDIIVPPPIYIDCPMDSHSKTDEEEDTGTLMDDNNSDTDTSKNAEDTKSQSSHSYHSSENDVSLDPVESQPGTSQSFRRVVHSPPPIFQEPKLNRGCTCEPGQCNCLKIPQINYKSGGGSLLLSTNDDNDSTEDLCETNKSHTDAEGERANRSFSPEEDFLSFEPNKKLDHILEEQSDEVALDEIEFDSLITRPPIMSSKSFMVGKETDTRAAEADIDPKHILSLMATAMKTRDQYEFNTSVVNAFSELLSDLGMMRAPDIGRKELDILNSNPMPSKLILDYLLLSQRHLSAQVDRVEDNVNRMGEALGEVRGVLISLQEAFLVMTDRLTELQTDIGRINRQNMRQKHVTEIADQYYHDSTEQRTRSSREVRFRSDDIRQGLTESMPAKRVACAKSDLESDFLEELMSMEEKNMKLSSNSHSDYRFTTLSKGSGTKNLVKQDPLLKLVQESDSITQAADDPDGDNNTQKKSIRESSFKSKSSSHTKREDSENLDKPRPQVVDVSRQRKPAIKAPRNEEEYKKRVHQSCEENYGMRLPSYLLTLSGEELLLLLSASCDPQMVKILAKTNAEIIAHKAGNNEINHLLDRYAISLEAKIRKLTSVMSNEMIAVLKTLRQYPAFKKFFTLLTKKAQKG